MEREYVRRDNVNAVRFTVDTKRPHGLGQRVSQSKSTTYSNTGDIVQTKRAEFRMFFVDRAAHFFKELQLMRESRIRSDASMLINRLQSFLKTQSFLRRRKEGGGG